MGGAESALGLKACKACLACLSCYGWAILFGEQLVKEGHQAFLQALPISTIGEGGSDLSLALRAHKDGDGRFPLPAGLPG